MARHKSLPGAGRRPGVFQFFEVHSSVVQGSRHQREFSSASETRGNTGPYGCTRSLVSSRGPGRRFRRPDTEDKSLPGRVLGRLRRDSSRARAGECPESYLLSACASACRKAACGLVPRRSGRPSAMRRLEAGRLITRFGAGERARCGTAGMVPGNRVCGESSGDACSRLRSY